MPIEFMQCPQCGSPLEIEPTARSATCPYCGSRLRVAWDAWGRGSAVLADIGDDTDLLARGMAISHVEQRLQEQLRAREELDQRRWSEVPATLRGKGDWSMIVVGLFFALLSATLAAVAWLFDSSLDVFFLAAAGAIMLWAISYQDQRPQAREKALNAASDKYGPALAQLDEKIGSTQKRLAELKADMDRLAREL